MQTNMQRLGNVMSDRMKRTSRAAVPVTVEFGIINDDLSLTTDSLTGKIAPEDYMVDLQLTHDTYFTYNELNSSAYAPHYHVGGEHEQESGDGRHEHRDGLHDHRVPSVFRRLEAGDRVLVFWVGNEPVITAIIVKGSTVTSN